MAGCRDSDLVTFGKTFGKDIACVTWDLEAHRGQGRRQKEETCHESWCFLATSRKYQVGGAGERRGWRAH
jgi:hypothetical protein